MEEIRLYLDDHLIDLPADVRTALRLAKAGTDASDLEQRRGEVSYSLTLPFTKPNDRFFAGVRNVQTAGKFNRTPPAARLYVGSRLLLRGAWQLTGVKGGYVGKLVSADVDVFTAIGAKTLQQLGFAPFLYRGQHDYEQLLTRTPATADLVWPLVAYGNFFHEPERVTLDDGTVEERDVPPSNRIGRGLEVDEVPPAASFSRVLKQIFADVGWRVAGKPLADAADVCLPYTGGQEYPWNWGELLKLTATNAAPLPFTDATAVPLDNEPPAGTQARAYYWVLEPDPVYNPARRYRPYPVGAGGATRRVYTARQDGGYHVQLIVEGLYRGASDPNPVAVQLLKVQPGAQVHEGEVLLSVPMATHLATDYVLDSQLAHPSGLFLQTGERLVAAFYCLEAWPPLQTTLYAAALSLTVTPVVADVGPLTIDVAAGLPGLLQRDFVKGFVTAANLRFVTDAATKTLTFYYRPDYELPPAFALDLSELASPDEVEIAPALTASRVVLAWAEDSGDALLTPGQHDAAFDAGGPDQEQKLQLPWAPVALRTFEAADGRQLALPCMASADALNTPLNQVSWTFGYTPRLLRYRGRSAVTDRVPLAFVESESGRYAKADWSGFSFAGAGGRYALHYQDYLQGLRRGHVLKASFALSAQLYAQLTPALPLRFHGLVYRLGQIQSFTAGGDQLTDCEFVHVAPLAIGGGLAPTGQPVERQHEFHPEEYHSDEWY
jgi:hypothetical protein